MAKTWWMSTLGSDSNSGSSYDDAKLTIAGIMSISTLGKGDTINIANDGYHDWPQSATPTDVKTGTKGANFIDDFGFLIRGTDPHGVPEKTTFRPSGANGVRSWLRMVADTGFVIVRDIIVDATIYSGDTNAYDFLELTDNGTPDPAGYRLEGVVFLGSGIGVTAAGQRHLLTVATTPSTSGWVYVYCYGCYFQNIDSNNLIEGIGTASKAFDYCLFWVERSSGATIGTLYSQVLAGSSSSAFIRVQNCTFYIEAYSLVISPILTINVGPSVAFGTVISQNNYIFMNSNNASPNPRFMIDSSAVSGETGTITIGNNVLLGGPDIDISNKNTNGWYTNAWDPDQNDSTGVDPYATDVEAWSQQPADLFVDFDSTYAWDSLGTGTYILLPRDIRPKKYLTSGVGGSLPGALPSFAPDVPDWIRKIPNAPLVETWEYLTSIVTSYDGSTEQRMSLRLQPRRRFEMSILIEDDDRRREEYRRIYASRGKILVPYFPYGTKITQTSNTGAIRIYFTLQKTDIRAYEYAMIYRSSTEESFILKLSALQTDGADVIIPLDRDVLKGDWIYPIQEGIIDNNVSLAMSMVHGYLSLGTSIPTARETFPNSDITIPSWTVFDSLYVLEKLPIVRSDVSEAFDRSPNVLDNETGIYSDHIHWLHDFITTPFKFRIARTNSMVDMEFWRSWTYIHRSMKVPFLMPSYRKDFVLSSIPSSSSLTIDVTTEDYSSIYFPYGAYKRLRLVSSVDGSIIYRKVDSVIVLSSTTQRLTLDSALPGTSEWASGFDINYLHKVRFGSDTFKLTHFPTYTIIESSIRTTDT